MAEKKLMVNLELLRCVAMMMVVVLHFLGKGGLLTGGDRSLSEGAVALDVTGYTAWLLESLCIVAVNVYMLISGYFLCTGSFKLSASIMVIYRFSLLCEVCCQGSSLKMFLPSFLFFGTEKDPLWRMERRSLNSFSFFRAL